MQIQLNVNANIRKPHWLKDKTKKAVSGSNFKKHMLYKWINFVLWCKVEHKQAVVILEGNLYMY